MNSTHIMERLKNTKTRKISSDHFTVIKQNDVLIGEGNFTVIAGPCALENEKLAVDTAKSVEKSGAGDIQFPSAGGSPLPQEEILQCPLSTHGSCGRPRRHR